jgi:hypothetical protein
MAAPLPSKALRGEEALLLVVANAAAMRAVGAQAWRPPAFQLAHADVAALAPGAVAQLRRLNESLTDALDAGDAARGRARLACVCRRVRAAADATSSSLPHVVSHARARACAAICADLATNENALLCGASTLARLCKATAPLPLPPWCTTATHHHAGGGSGASAVAAAWRALAREVADAAPEEHPALAFGVQAFVVSEATLRTFAPPWLGAARRLRPGEPPNSRAKQLELIRRVTQAEVHAAGEAAQ